LSTGLATFGLFGPSNGELSSKYALLIAPAGFAFAIWGPIFAWEAFFSLAQLLPSFRNSRIVDLVTPGFVGACVAQAIWNIVFAQEMILVAVICMSIILAGLMLVAFMTDGVPMTWAEYFCLRGMMSLHGGWIVCASALNGNILFVSYKSSPEVTLGLAITSIGAICVISTIFAVGKLSPDPIVPAVAAWAFNAINAKLDNPQDLFNNERLNPHTWSKETLGGLQVAAQLVTYLAAGLAAVAVLRSIRQQCGGEALHDVKGLRHALSA